MHREPPGTCDEVASPTSASQHASVPTSARDARGLRSCRSPASWLRDNRSRENAKCRQTSPANKSDARRAAASLAEPASPCDLERAKPSVRLEPTAESENVCCRPASARYARALRHSMRGIGHAPLNVAAHFARLSTRSLGFLGKRRLSPDTSGARRWV